MFLLNIDATQITVDDLQALIDNQVIESRDIEYKQTINVGQAADEKKKIKLVAGISSFANADGGDFLVGIRAEDGIPKQITPIERNRVDEIKLAAEQLIQTGISPRISVAIHEIRVSNAHSVLLVRIPKSWGAPHRVTLAGHNNFYGRHSSGMYSTAAATGFKTRAHGCYLRRIVRSHEPDWIPVRRHGLLTAFAERMLSV